MKALPRWMTIFILLLLISGCKKETNDTPGYACDCTKYGLNPGTFLLDKPLSLIPFYDADKKWGFMDNSGTIIFSPKYHMALRFSNDRALIVDNSTGVEFVGFIDRDGNMAIQPKYRFSDSFFTKEGLIPVGDVKTFKIGFLNRDGNMAVPFLYATVSMFHEGLAMVGNGTFQGAIDVNGNIKIPMEYVEVGLFSEGLAFVNSPQGKHGYINTSNQYVIEGDFTQGGWFINGLAWVNDPISHLYGFIRRDGSYLVEPVFQDVNDFWEGYAGVRKDGKWGFINKIGEFVIECQFEAVDFGFSEGLAGVRKNGQWGYIDYSGKWVIQPQFSIVDVFVCGAALVDYPDGTYGFIDRSGKSIWKSNFDRKGSGTDRPVKLTDQVSIMGQHSGN